jgi:DNA-directed RNA polymerase sigma subunit (sigma70/sigma32)
MKKDISIEEMCRDIILVSGGNLEMADFDKLKETEIRVLYYRLVKLFTLEKIGKVAYEKSVTRERARQTEHLALRKLIASVKRKVLT